MLPIESPYSQVYNSIAAGQLNTAIGAVPTIVTTPEAEIVDSSPSVFGEAYENYNRPLKYEDPWLPGGFSATDLNVYIQPPSESGIAEPIKFGSLAMLTVSSHRDKFPVAALARIAPKGFTNGHRTIAGTLAFNTFQRDAFDWTNSAGQRLTSRGRSVNGRTWRFDLKPDELPPFDIQIVLINDMGDAAVKTLRGVTLLDTGCTYSLDNIILTETYSYMALEQTPLRPISERTVKTNPAVDYTRPHIMDTLPEGSRGLVYGRPEDVA